MTLPLRALLCLIVIALCAPAYADVTLPPIFSDSAVLQREINVPIWGWDNPGQEVTVTLGAQSKSAKADEKGYWIVKLDPMKAGGPFRLTVKGSSTAECNDILIGDVWFCSGQSNMAYEMKAASSYKAELASADRPTLRQFKVPAYTTYIPSPKPPLDPAKADPQWTLCSAQTLAGFSAVSFHFAKDIQANQNVPVGIINSSWGGTIIQAWTSRPTLQKIPNLHSVTAQQVKNQLAQLANPQSAPTTQPAKPIPPNTASVLYNGMVAPIAPYAIRGAVWYQGESNSNQYQEYQSYLTSLIKDWRATWGQGDFPFLVVQLPNYKKDFWPQMREAQAQAVQETPNADMAVTIDLGNPLGIHPNNKKDVGARLALAALQSVYGQKILGHSPTLDNMKIQGDKVILTFTNAPSGLVTKDGQPPKLFEIAGDEPNYLPANAVISGNSITLTHPDLKSPKAVRFAWSSEAPGFNLFSKDGLPVAPFRTRKDAPPAPPATAPARSK
jgi:sialate O-acetylesterase